MTEANEHAVLHARARALARPTVDVEDAAETVEVVVFALARERYAVEARFVRAVLRTSELTTVPGLPDFVVGVTNLRGEILAVLDLRRFLGNVTTGLTDLARLIVLGEAHAEFGLLADSVHEVVGLRPNALLPPPASAGGDGNEHVRGITPDALVVLDAAALLRDERLYIDQGEKCSID